MHRQVGLLFFLAAVFCSPLSASDCAFVKEFSHDRLVEFLKEDAHTADPECTAQAIYKLGIIKSNDESAISVLVDLLDFRRPPREPEKLHIWTNHDWFPAVPALFSTGKSAVPFLVKSLADPGLPQTRRENALRALLSIYREDPPAAVSVLVNAAKSAQNQTGAVSLETAAQDEAKICSRIQRLKSRCEAALNPE
jgi:hypothetical protein